LQVAYHDFEFSPEATAALESQGERGEHAKDIIKKLLNRDPLERRAFVRTIKSHPFFDGIDWYAIQIQQAEVEEPPDWSLAANTTEVRTIITLAMSLPMFIYTQPPLTCLICTRI